MSLCAWHGAGKRDSADLLEYAFAKVAIVLMVLAILVHAQSSWAQDPIEENTPPQQVGPQLSNLPVSDANVTAQASDESFGVKLQSIVVLDSARQVAATPVAGIDTSKARGFNGHLQKKNPH